ncbi:MAG TPA: HAD hydrolase-like protein [Methylomirabilota bacterium]|nr:HAD hydrolase-like protein [Methylomirabilota bacterium]
MKLVLFDVDGTLITSRGAGRRAMRLAFERTFGTAGGIDHYDLRGRTDTRIVHDVMAAAGWDAARIKERLDDFFEAYLRGLVAEIGDGRGVVTLPGVAALVEALIACEDVVVGLVTGNIEEGARIKLLPTGLWPHFRVGAYGSDHMDRRYLPPLAARRAHALLGHDFPPRDVVVIGDTPHDVDCARACGAVAVAVATGQYPREALLADAPDHFFEDLSDTDAVLRAVRGRDPGR